MTDPLKPSDIEDTINSDCENSTNPIGKETDADKLLDKLRAMTTDEFFAGGLDPDAAARDERVETPTVLDEEYLAGYGGRLNTNPFGRLVNDYTTDVVFERCAIVGPVSSIDCIVQLPDLPLSEEGIHLLVEQASARGIPPFSDALVKTALAAYVYKAAHATERAAREEAEALRDEADSAAEHNHTLWEQSQEHVARLTAALARERETSELLETQLRLTAKQLAEKGSGPAKAEKPLSETIAEIRAIPEWKNPK